MAEATKQVAGIFVRRRRASALAIVLAAVASLVLASGVGASTIIFATSGNGLNSGRIWSVGADGSGLRQLRSKVPWGLSGVAASISRDGKHIFCLCRGTEIDSMKLDGSDLRKVGRFPVKTEYTDVVLGPGGEPFWFKGAHLMTEGRDGGHPHPAVKGRFAELLGAGIPRRGRRIALSAGDTVYRAPLGGGPKTEIYHSAIPGLRYVRDMSWSADGKKLVFVDYPEQEKYETPADPKAHAFLYANGAVHELPLSQEAIERPIFSPDSTRLASVGKDASIFLSSLRGGPATRILSLNCAHGRCLFPQLLGWIP